MKFKEWYEKYPLDSYIMLKYNFGICKAQIIEYSFINNKIFMTAGIHTIVFDGSSNSMYLSENEFNNFPVLNTSEGEFIKIVN